MNVNVILMDGFWRRYWKIDHQSLPNLVNFISCFFFNDIDRENVAELIPLCLFICCSNIEWKHTFIVLSHEYDEWADPGDQIRIAKYETKQLKVNEFKRKTENIAHKKMETQKTEPT